MLCLFSNSSSSLTLAFIVKVQRNPSVNIKLGGRIGMILFEIIYFLFPSLHTISSPFFLNSDMVPSTQSTLQLHSTKWSRTKINVGSTICESQEIRTENVKDQGHRYYPGGVICFTASSKRTTQNKTKKI